MILKRAIQHFALGAALVAGFAAAAPAAQAQVYISAGIAPPAIPVYDQPPCPEDGDIWTPGYWAWDGNQYYWVDGSWVEPPYVEALWTPGWWGWGTGAYFWHPGYWGRNVGYYGGINYGFGYFGVGFYGGYWNGGHFWYNRAYGHFGGGFRGNFYDHRYAGFSGRPGGPSFNAHPAGFGARGSEFNHSSPVESRSGFSAGAQRGFAGQGVNGQQRGFSGGTYNGAQRGFSQPGYNGAQRGFSQPAYGGGQRGATQPGNGGGQRSFAAPANGGGGGRSYSAPSGGRSAAAPSGGGGSHGGGGSSHGGGGSSHGGGGRR